MTDLTPESVAVRLYAAYWDGRQGTPEDIAMYLSCNPVGERWKSVAAEHERICSERIAAAEKAARIKALEDALECISDQNGVKNMAIENLLLLETTGKN